MTGSSEPPIIVFTTTILRVTPEDQADFKILLETVNDCQAVSLGGIRRPNLSRDSLVSQFGNLPRARILPQHLDHKTIILMLMLLGTAKGARG